MLQRGLILLGVALAATPFSFAGFSLLDHPSETSLAAGDYVFWQKPGPGASEYVPGVAYVLTYAIDDEFMSDEDEPTRLAAKQAVKNAVATWQFATNGFVKFQEAAWDPVENHDTQPRAVFEGPGLAEWLLYWNQQNPDDSDWPEGWGDNPQPGWGANIDVFSRPTGFTMTSNGINYVMSSGILGFAAVHRSGNQIRSVDLYLNADFDWTTSTAAAATAPIPAQGFAFCGCERRHEGITHSGQPRPLPSPGAASSLPPTYDIETVVLHELGHGMGLDHPNEAPMEGGALLEPYTFVSLPLNGSSWTSQAVMHGAYNGVKRQLREDDFGGMAYLYLPGLNGDLSADGDLSFLDAFYGLGLVTDPELPNPYESNILDFAHRNGVVDLDEISYLMFWVFQAGGYQPGVVTEVGGNSVLLSSLPRSITLTAEPRPSDLGLGGTVDVVIHIENPDQTPVTAWCVPITYDPAVLSNPRLADGDFLPGGVFWLQPGTSSGSIELSKLSLGETDTSEFGVLGTVTFDINLPLAIAEKSTVVAMTDVELVVTDPILHTFGDPAFPDESLYLADAEMMTSNFDGDQNGVVNVDDWYLFCSAPFDVDQDGDADEEDGKRLENGVRSGELADMLGYPPNSTAVPLHVLHAPSARSRPAWSPTPGEALDQFLEHALNWQQRSQPSARQR